MSLISELKQGKLVQWAATYVAAAFALLQGAHIIAPHFAWPESVSRFLVIASFVGFFIAVLLAWYHGERGAQKVSGVELLILSLLPAIGGAVLLAVRRECAFTVRIGCKAVGVGNGRGQRRDRRSQGHRRAAVRQHVRRQGQRILLRRHQRGDPHRRGGEEK